MADEIKNKDIVYRKNNNFECFEIRTDKEKVNTHKRRLELEERLRLKKEEEDE